MEPILEARKIKIEEQSKRFTTYKNCPPCKGYFHSAKACIFRRHVGHVNEMQRNIQQLAEQFGDLDISGSMVLPVPTEAEEQLYSDSSDEGEYDIEDEKDRRPLTLFEQILQVISTIKHGNPAPVNGEEDQGGEDRENPEADDEDQNQKAQPGQPDQQNRDHIDTDSGYGSLPPTFRDDRKYLRTN